jgi:hypothetical protein
MRGARVFLSMWAVVFTLMALFGQPSAGQAPKRISLVPVGSYQTLAEFLGDFENEVFDTGAAEIVAYDQQTRQAFLTFAERPRIEIVNLWDPTSPSLAGIIDLTPFTPAGADAHATSVAAHEGIVAVAVPQGQDDTGPGRVLFFDTAGTYLNQVTVGALPDMLTFTPNGRFVLTADEGQPTSDYSYDPEGSVSIIDMRDGPIALTQGHVTIAGFEGFNAPAAIDPRIRVFGPGASVAQDLEPEYIAVAHDSLTAWVTLQENNALGLVDLTTRTVTALMALGFKDHGLAGNALDGSDRDGPGNSGLINITTWPGVLGMYQPDAIKAFHSAGRTYLVTANEGDVRDYDGFGEAERLKDVTLDPAAFPNAAMLQDDDAIGRFNITTSLGDSDGDGDFDRVYAFGGRSFSVWSASGDLVWDSGDAFEQLTAALYPATFNASSTNNILDNRSDDKGPEPEGIAVAKLFGRDYVFVALERIGGVMVYDITDPASPAFVQSINMRDFTKDPDSGLAGDLGPEGFVVIESSALGAPMVLVSNEVSGTLRIFKVEQAK